MNLILFEPGEWEQPFPLDDPRVVHLKQVLKRPRGEEFDAGVIDGPRGKALIEDETAGGMKLSFRPTEEPESLAPVILAVGASRPQTARKVLLQATTMGVSEIHFFASGRGEKGYLRSSVYKPESIRPYLIEGAQQAFCTRLPKVTVHQSFQECLEALKNTRGVCLDNYEATAPLHRHLLTGESTDSPLALWVGSERGWSPAERDAFRNEGMTLCSLGSRVLRTETAVVAGLTLCLAGTGMMD